VPELTAQELRVARLVASGLSNREVAAELYLSQKTVEYHLAHAFTKLGVRSRHQLGTRIHDRENPGGLPQGDPRGPRLGTNLGNSRTPAGRAVP
jgi:DNA-binding CsgD family transcriptional regulator